MLQWLEDNVLNLIVFVTSIMTAFLLGYKKYILLEVRVSSVENKTTSFEAEIKEELREIKEDIKKLLARE